MNDNANGNCAGLVLNEKGQCPACEKKPLVYKRQHLKFCMWCSREFNIETGRQIESRTWKSTGAFTFQRQ
jgi:hypothetical protein